MRPSVDSPKGKPDSALTDACWSLDWGLRPCTGQPHCAELMTTLDVIFDASVPVLEEVCATCVAIGIVLCYHARPAMWHCAECASFAHHRVTRIVPPRRLHDVGTHAPLTGFAPNGEPLHRLRAKNMSHWNGCSDLREGGLCAQFKVDAKAVKALRDKTGAGMMDAKKALISTDGDIDKAVEYLRKKGLASADKKAGRVAAEGIIASYIHAGSRCVQTLSFLESCWPFVTGENCLELKRPGSDRLFWLPPQDFFWLFFVVLGVVAALCH